MLVRPPARRNLQAERQAGRVASRRQADHRHSGMGPGDVHHRIAGAVEPAWGWPQSRRRKPEVDSVRVHRGSQRLAELLAALQISRELFIRHRLAALDQLDRLAVIELAEAGKPVAVDSGGLSGDDAEMALGELAEVFQGRQCHDLVTGGGQTAADLTEMDQTFTGRAL